MPLGSDSICDDFTLIYYTTPQKHALTSICMMKRDEARCTGTLAWCCTKGYQLWHSFPVARALAQLDNKCPPSFSPTIRFFEWLPITNELTYRMLDTGTADAKPDATKVTYATAESFLLLLCLPVSKQQDRKLHYKYTMLHKKTWLGRFTGAEYSTHPQSSI